MKKSEYELEMEQLFIEMFDDDNFEWDEMENIYYFLNELSVKEDQYGGDGYINVENVFRIQDRYFKINYDLMGKDLDEEYNMTEPVEVYPHEVTSIEFKEEPVVRQSNEDNTEGL